MLTASTMTRGDLGGVLLAASLVACGGRTGETAASGDSGPDSGSQDAGPDAAPACPADAPAQGSACQTTGLQCQYGTNLFDGCAQLADCTEAGWNLSGPPATCSSSQCPASYASLADASALVACSPALQVTDCWYPQGVCQCSDGLGGPAAPLGWYCVPVAPGCPYPTPAVGSPCTTPGQVCGASCADRGVECDGGTWQVNESTCPA